MKKENNFDLDDTDIEDFSIDNKSLIPIIISCSIISLIITLIHNTNIDIYIKDMVIPFVLMITGYIILILKNNFEINEKAYILLIPIILILLGDTIAGIDISNKILNVFVLPVLISMFFFLLTNKNYKITKESLKWIFKLFPKDIFHNLTYAKNPFNSTDLPKTKLILNILSGCLIGIPIAAVLLYLLADADKYFGEFIGFILNAISKVFSVDFIFSDLLILVTAFVVLFGIFINILKNRHSKLDVPTYRELNHVVSSTILIIVNAIFVLFTISEISKLTGNFLQLPLQYTYAQYAREGFFQLLIVTTINFSIILYYIYCTNISKDNRFIKNLILLLIAFSIILIFNSYYRMFLYIGAYGFTVLRLQVILFLTMELVLFGILIKKIVNKLKNDDSLLFTTITLLFYILNIYFCTSAFANLLNYL